MIAEIKSEKILEKLNLEQMNQNVADLQEVIKKFAKGSQLQINLSPMLKKSKTPAIQFVAD